MSSALRSILSDFTRIEGVNGACIISKDGFVVEHVMPGITMDLDALAAMIVTIYGASGRLSEELKLGDLDLMTLEYLNNIVLIENLGDVLLAVIADRRAILGRIRYEIKRQKDRIKAAL